MVGLAVAIARRAGLLDEDTRKWKYALAACKGGGPPVESDRVNDEVAKVWPNHRGYLYRGLGVVGACRHCSGRPSTHLRMS